MLAVAGTIGCINIVQTELRALFLDSASPESHSYTAGVCSGFTVSVSSQRRSTKEEKLEGEDTGVSTDDDNLNFCKAE